jgi:hypothetical protein
VDVQFPKEHGTTDAGRGFFVLKYEVALLLEQYVWPVASDSRVLDLSMKLRRPPDCTVASLHRKL